MRTSVCFDANKYSYTPYRFASCFCLEADIDDIEMLTKNINDKRDVLNKLELDNQKVEILSLLREFCLIDAYEGLEEILSLKKEGDLVYVAGSLYLVGEIKQHFNPKEKTVEV